MKTIFKAFLILILYGTNICSGATIEEHSYKSVYIDPFYGGKDAGPLIAKTYKAKDLTLRIGKLLQQKLEARGATTILSRTKDVFLSPDNRTVIAKAQAADVYVGVRVSYQNNDGIKLYHLKYKPTKAKTSEDRDELSEIFRELAFNDLAYESDRLANVISSKLKKEVLTIPVSASAQYGDDTIFYVVTSSHCPVIIIDFSVPKSADDHSYILNSSLIDSVTTSIVEGLTEFMKRSVIEIN